MHYQAHPKMHCKDMVKYLRISIDDGKENIPLTRSTTDPTSANDHVEYSDLFGLAPIWSGRLAALCIGCGSADFAAGVAWI